MNVAQLMLASRASAYDIDNYIKHGHISPWKVGARNNFTRLDVVTVFIAQATKGLLGPAVAAKAAPAVLGYYDRTHPPSETGLFIWNSGDGYAAGKTVGAATVAIFFACGPLFKTLDTIEIDS